MSRDALAQYDTDRQRSTQPPQAVAAESRSTPVWGQATRDYHSMDDYYAARRRARAGWEQPPAIIVQHMAPNYGIWDVAFMSMLMSNINRPGYADWAAAHQNDADYRRWRDDAERAAKDNAELRGRLDAMDERMRTADATSTQARASLPPGVEPAAAIAPEAMVDNPFGAATSTDAAASTKAHKSGSGFWKWMLGILAGIAVLGLGGVLLLARYGRSK